MPSANKKGYKICFQLILFLKLGYHLFLFTFYTLFTNNNIRFGASGPVFDLYTRSGGETTPFFYTPSLPSHVLFLIKAISQKGETIALGHPAPYTKKGKKGSSRRVGNHYSKGKKLF